MAKPKNLAEFNQWTPPLFAAYCFVMPTKKNGLQEPLLSRLGAAHSIEGCRKLIADNKKAMGETFGGLIAPQPIDHRHYRAFQLGGGGHWQPLKL